MAGEKAHPETCWGAGRQFLGQDAPRLPSPMLPCPEQRGASVCPPSRSRGLTSGAGRLARGSLPSKQDVQVQVPLPPPWQGVWGGAPHLWLPQQRGRVWGQGTSVAGFLPPKRGTPPRTRGGGTRQGQTVTYSGLRVPPPLPLAPQFPSKRLPQGEPPPRGSI